MAAISALHLMELTFLGDAWRFTLPIKVVKLQGTQVTDEAKPHI
jgi:hypothetical protein